MRPITLITGASAGIGAALAQVFAAHGHELVLVARREQRLLALADAIAARGQQRPVVLPIDLARADVADRIGSGLACAGSSPISSSTMPASAWSEMPRRSRVLTNSR
jgi:uncharacterized protein